MTTKTKSIGVVAAALLALAAARPAAAGRGDDALLAGAARYAYHLRLVRVAGAGESRGAALGCGRTCGRPIVVPAEEAWGTPAQIDGLARALGGTRADAVTGFIVLPGADGAARFEGTVYPGEAVVGIEFSAQAPPTPDAPHDLQLTITPSAGGAPILEARVLSASERTIAIAAPSPVEGEWLVLAVTTLDPVAAEARVTAGAPVEEGGGPVTFPVLVDRVMPRYATQARREGRQGKVFIDAVIDAEGRVRAPMILRVDPGIEDLAASAVEAVEQWHYQPGMRDGAPVSVRMTIMVDFTLE